MLVWLNGNQNIRQKPNENYARELMEVFTLGANRGAYTETDVREQARALTGWQGNVVNRQSTGFAFNTARHDTGTKTIFGKIGQLQLGGLVPALPRQPGAPVVLRREDVELLHPDEDRQRDVDGAAGALREPPGQARRRVDPAAPGVLRGAADDRSRRSCSTPACCGCAAATSTRRPGGRSASRRASSSSTRRTSAAGTTRAGSTRRRSARAGSWPRTRRTPSTPPDSPSDPAQLLDRALAFWGSPTITPTTQGLLKSFAAAQLKRKIDAGNVETALRRLIATSPDLQTA